MQKEKNVIMDFLVVIKWLKIRLTAHTNPGLNMFKELEGKTKLFHRFLNLGKKTIRFIEIYFY